MRVEKSENYKKLIDKHSEKSPVVKDCILAFLCGGFLCFIGQWLAFLYIYLGVGEKDSYLLVTVTFIIAAALATALGFFDKFARLAGAGTLVPVTGFSNAVTSAAIDNRSEGFITGVGSKIFTVAGPVILFSTLAGTLYGFIYYFYTLFS